MLCILRPQQEIKPLIRLNEENYGKSTSEKLKTIRDQMRILNVHSTVITSLDEMAWLLNVRGMDIPFGTVFFAYAIITDTDLKLFTDLERLEASESGAVKRALLEQEPRLELYTYGQFYTYFEDFVKREIVDSPQPRKIFLSSSSNHFVHSLVPFDLIQKDMSLVARLKIIKNQNEVNSAKAIHIRDSITLVELFYKLDKHFQPGPSSHFFHFLNILPIITY